MLRRRNRFGAGLEYGAGERYGPIAGDFEVIEPRGLTLFWEEFEVPDTSRAFRVYFEEFQVPDAPRALRVFHEAFEIPVPVRALVVFHEVFEVPTAERALVVYHEAFVLPESAQATGFGLLLGKRLVARVCGSDE